jgi:hypothetical protein
MELELLSDNPTVVLKLKATRVSNIGVHSRYLKVRIKWPYRGIHGHESSDSVVIQEQVFRI